MDKSREGDPFTHVSFEFNEDPRTSQTPQRAYGIFRDNHLEPISFDIHYASKYGPSSVVYNFLNNTQLPNPSELESMLTKGGVSVTSLRIK